MSLINRKYKSSLIITIFMVQLIFLALPMTNQNIIVPIQTSDEEQSNISKNMLGIDPISAADTILLGWWNESYQFRVRFEIDNTLSHARSMPIDLWLEVDADDKCNDQSIRVVKYDQSEGNDIWTPIPNQIWNTTTYANTNIKSTTITFVVNDMPSGISVYYVYYDPDTTFDTTDYSDYSFSASLSTNKISVDWDDQWDKSYSLEMDENYGIYKLEDNYGKNYHNDNSSAPGIANLDEDLIGYWNFDDGTPEEVTDNIPDGDPAGYSEEGNIDYRAGKYGQAKFFDGSNDWVFINGNQDLYGGGNDDITGITIMAWVQMQGTGERIIASWDRSEYWRFAIDNSNHVYWATSANNIQDMHGTLTVTNNEWHHIAASYDVATGIKKIYVDGILDPASGSHSAGAKFDDYHADSNGATRYGFIGTGSESPAYPASESSNTPQLWMDGGLDEFRIYNKTLNLQEIQRAMDAAVEVTDIDVVTTTNTDGNVMASYEINWDPMDFKEGELDVTDNITFYRGLNMFEVERTYYWDTLMAPGDNAFSGYNTLFNWDPVDGDSVKDQYYYDGNFVDGLTDPSFTVENYTIIHDHDSTEHGTAVGLFVTELNKGHNLVDFSELSWAIDVDENNDLINFIPGNETDLDNKGGGPTDYTITVTYWEYIRNDFNYQPASAVLYFNNMYASLTTPLIINDQTEESLFFNLEINIKDIDGLDVDGVNVTLLSYTIDPITYSYESDKMSNSVGNTTFTNLQTNNFTVNLTYPAYNSASPLHLGAWNVTINQTETTYQNIKAVDLTVNLTSLELGFHDEDGVPIVGAEISFKENSSSVYTNIGTASTDAQGNVTLRWRNMTQGVTQVDFNCLFLGVNRLINITDGDYQNNHSVDFVNLSYQDVEVTVGDFSTNMSLTDLTSNYVWGENLIFNVTYNFTENILLPGDQYTPIPDAIVNYKIQYKGENIIDANFIPTNSSGHSYNAIDYTPSGLDLELEAGLSYTLRITVSKPGFTTLVETLNFELDHINTTIAIIPENQDAVYWNRNITINVTAFDTYNTLPVDGVTLNYYVQEDPTINGVILGNSTSGAYSIEFNSTEFKTTGDYTLKISSDKINYADNQTELIIHILDITTEMNFEQSNLEVFWLENITLNVEINDTLLIEGMNGATLSWVLVGNGAINGQLLRNSGKGDGWYTLEVNSTEFSYAGIYFLQISATQDNWEDKTDLIQLRIKEIFTLVNDSSTDISEINIFRTEDILMTFNYTSRIGGEGSTIFTTVVDATYTTYEWESITNPALSGTGELTYNAVTKMYELDFDTENLEIGKYSITIRLQEINFLSRVAVIFLEVKPILFDYGFLDTVDIDFTDDVLKYKVFQGDETVIRLDLKDALTDTSNANAQVYWFDGTEFIAFTNNGDGLYTYTITADVDAFFEQQIIEGKIVIIAIDHEMLNITTHLTVQMPEIMEGIPMFYFVLVVGFITVFSVGIGGYKYIQYARIPEFIKDCNQVEKEILKKKSINPDDLVTSTKNKIIIDKLGELWSFVGLDIKYSLGIQKEIPESRNTDGGN